MGSSSKSGIKLVVNPMYIGVFVVYGLTRLFQYVTNTDQLWTKFWHKILDTLGDDDFSMHFVWTTIYNAFFTYWFFGGVIIFMDVMQWPKFMRKYKIQEGRNEPMDMKLLKHAIVEVLKNQIFISVPLSYLGYLSRQSKGLQQSLRDVPSFDTVVYHLAACILIDEIGFYYSHRLFHQAHLYKWFHKKHHEWTAPIAITALYAHPLEHVFSNLLPVTLGPALFNVHLSVTWIWYTLAQLTTLNNHSGYHFPWCLSSELHDFHHSRFVECFGKQGILDRLHSTDALFRKTINNTRHRVLLGLESAREKFPAKSD